MDTTRTPISSQQAQSYKLKPPLFPARLCMVGATRSRRQSTGEIVLFVAVEIRTIFTRVPSNLDGYASDWTMVERAWVPFDSLEPGELTLVKVV